METVMEMPATGYAPLAVDPAWVRVCRLDDLADSWGEAALVKGQQLALFRVGRGDVFAVSQADPATRAHVMSRGMVGSRGRTHTIASPLHKEVYSLATGECFGRPELHLGTYPVRVVDGVVEVSV
ncbi:nitrite reductase small subunit NirD [Arthrobacter glacialis]|uniref:Nitrite reductase (NAD(P)H) small subunit n=1 Tax=Arthrobacter glacialis TaxID=1664 RepID=A0A2S4A0X5_ARTGL|nr:nitrite reductase small subunit NirD [Arthrobacter glacialis]POH74939.1 nitrite reductase (NAD(P)H) small subunit [Arthrobacter glacialis]